jgi:hypothetical protein
MSQCRAFRLQMFVSGTFDTAAERLSALQDFIHSDTHVLQGTSRFRSHAESQPKSGAMMKIGRSSISAEAGALLSCFIGRVAYASGRVKKKMLPVPGVLSTQMRPPCCCTMLRQIARPRPVPPLSRESEALTC